MVVKDDLRAEITEALHPVVTDLNVGILQQACSFKEYFNQSSVTPVA